MKYLLSKIDNLQTLIFVMSVIAVFCISCDENNILGSDNVAMDTNETISIGNSTYSAQSAVTSQKAIEVASVFWSELGNSTRADFGKLNYDMTPVCTGDDTLMYVINYDKGGFIIISATKDYYPVIAFSEKGNYPVGEEEDMLRMWLNDTKNAITESRNYDDSIKTTFSVFWQQYEDQDTSLYIDRTRSSPSSAEMACLARLEYYYRLTSGSGGWNFAPLSQVENTFSNLGLDADYESLCFRAQANNSAPNETLVGWKVVSDAFTYGPLLNTTWSQHSPYNDLLANKAGCGAIAVSQIMNYYKHPETFSLNGITYNWDNIPDEATSGSDQAALVRYVYLQIESCFTTAIFFGNYSEFVYTAPDDLVHGMRNMGYNVVERNHNSEKVLLELHNNRPVIMFGNDDNYPEIGVIGYVGNSHYWVCDGGRDRKYYLIYFAEWQPYGNGTFIPGWYSYESPDRVSANSNHYQSFHMNWGWGGNENGWFLFESTGTSKGDFKHNRKDYIISVAN